MMDDLGILKSWIVGSNSCDDERKGSTSFAPFLAYLMAHDRDGISLLSPDLTIIAVNRTMARWYEGKDPPEGEKCYRVYHGRNRPCRDCPVLGSLSSGCPVTREVPFEASSTRRGRQELTAFPVTDGKGNVIAVLEHVRDATTRGEEREALDDLARELSLQSRRLEEQEVALRVLGSQMGQDRDEALKEVSLKIRALIMPLLRDLKKDEDDPYRMRKLSMLEKHIDELDKPVISRLPLQDQPLTHRELQVALYVKEGYSSKEIAELICVSKRTVDYHRNNLRSKFRLDGRDSTLQTFLMGIE
jgi:DNA-binding CsgD family transcriptional regulator